MKTIREIKMMLIDIRVEIAKTSMMIYVQTSNKILVDIKNVNDTISDAMKEVSTLANSNYKEFKDPELAHRDMEPYHEYRKLAKEATRLKDIHLKMLALAKEI